MSLKIIAEIAQGYEGNLTQSKLFIKAAAFSGADLVKFQLVYADELCTKDYKYYDLFKSLEIFKIIFIIIILVNFENVLNVIKLLFG